MRKKFKKILRKIYIQVKKEINISIKINREKSANKIQSLYRGYQLRKYIYRLNISANKIQSLYRGYQLRKYIDIFKIKDNKICIFILTEEYITDCAIYLKILLNKLNIESEIIFKLNNLSFIYRNLFIVITLKNSKYNYKLIPKNFVFWQIEQVENIHLSNNNSNYFKIMKKSLHILEISRKNYEYYKYFIDNRNVYYNQLPYANLGNNKFINKDIDLFFFGSFSKEREKKLKEIKKKLPEYNILYYWHIFNKFRNELISRSKFVLNLHYYKNSVLEADRINICINNNTFIISENVKNDSYNKSLYKNFVYYIDEINDNLNNLDNCIEQINNILKKNVYDIKANKSFLQNKIKLENKCLYDLHKNISIINHPIMNNYNIKTFNPYNYLSYSDNSSSSEDS
jgi:hypothetical protein